MERDDLVLTTGSCLNPATFLWKGETRGEDLVHNCLDIIEYQTQVYTDLRDVPFHEGLCLFIDGSSRVINGKRHNGYAIIDGNNNSLKDADRLPNTRSAQTCELYALNQH